MPDPDEVLPEYERPEMPWERKATELPGRGATAMGSEFAVTMALFMALGWWLDGKFDLSPWLLLAGTGLGLTVGIYRLATAGARALRREERRASRRS